MRLAVAVLAMGVTSCKTDCLQVATSALVVFVRDAKTHNAILPGSIVVFTRDGVRDSVIVSLTSAAESISIGSQQTGVFSVTVRKAGYQDASQTNINVDASSCGNPNTEEIVIDLVSLP